jgi:hypothetical protein
MEDIDEYLKRDDELTLGEKDRVSRQIDVLLLWASIPLVTNKASNFQKHIFILLIVSWNDIRGTVRNEAIQSYIRVWFGLSYIEVLVLIQIS